MKKLHLYIVLIFIISPVLTIIYLSVVSSWSFPQLWQADFTINFWKGLVQSDNELKKSFIQSLFISTSLALLATLFGFSMSKQIMLNKKLHGLLQLSFYPYLIAPVVLGSMLQFYFVRWGLTGTLPGVMIAQLLFIFPYSVLILSAFWNDRIKKIAFQANCLGASNHQVNRSILMPMAKPWLLLCLVQCFLISWFEYGITQLVGVGKVETLTIKTMHFVKEANPHQAALAACLMIFPVLLILIFNQRLIANKTS